MRVVQDGRGARTVVQQLRLEDGEGFCSDVREVGDGLCRRRVDELVRLTCASVLVDPASIGGLPRSALVAVKWQARELLTMMSGNSHQKAVELGRSLFDFGRSSSTAELNLAQSLSKYRSRTCCRASEPSAISHTLNFVL